MRTTMPSLTLHQTAAAAVLDIHLTAKQRQKQYISYHTVYEAHFPQPLNSGYYHSSFPNDTYILCISAHNFSSLLLLCQLFCLSGYTWMNYLQKQQSEYYVNI